MERVNAERLPHTHPVYAILVRVHTLGYEGTRLPHPGPWDCALRPTKVSSSAGSVTNAPDLLRRMFLLDEDVRTNLEHVAEGVELDLFGSLLHGEAEGLECPVHEANKASEIMESFAELLHKKMLEFFSFFEHLSIVEVTGTECNKFRWRALSLTSQTAAGISLVRTPGRLTTQIVTDMLVTDSRLSRFFL